MIFKEIDNTRDVGVICHYLSWVNSNRIFSVSFRLCGEPRCSDLNTEEQRPYSLPDLTHTIQRRARKLYIS